MILGYCRVSTADQNLALQRDALTKAGVERIFSDKGVSGIKRRPQLEKMLKALGPGDVVVIWRLDRIGRSLPDLLRVVETVQQRGATLRSLSEHIDLSTAAGRLLVNVLGSLATFERDLLLERTRAGIEAARARGKHLGRPKALDAGQVRQAMKLVEGGETVRDVAAGMKVSHMTLYRALRAAGA
jgi:DNA invertase Pin-like site-specific DNA recombinase